jgi:hypothetical protein
MTRPDPLFEEHARTLATVIGPPRSLQRCEALLRAKIAEGVWRGWISPDWLDRLGAFTVEVLHP